MTSSLGQGFFHGHHIEHSISFYEELRKSCIDSSVESYIKYSKDFLDHFFPVWFPSVFFFGNAKHSEIIGDVLDLLMLMDCKYGDIILSLWTKDFCKVTEYEV